MSAPDASLRLAGALARPFATLDVAHLGVGTLSGAELAAIAAHPRFSAPLDRCLVRTLGFDRLALDDGALARLHAPRARLAVLLLAEPLATVREASLLVAGAALHRQVLGLLLRSDRERIRAMLGEAAFHVATQEAPVLHAPLADLSDGVALDGAIDPGDGRAALEAVGLRGLSRLVEAVEPELARVFVSRLPPGLLPDGEPTPLDRSRCDHLVRLVRRRMPAWAAFIG